MTTPRKRRVKMWARSSFGLYFAQPIPNDRDMVLICADTSMGHRPISICMPHQLYRAKLREMFHEHPDAQSITIMPYSNAEKIEITRSATLPAKPARRKKQK